MAAALPLLASPPAPAPRFSRPFFHGAVNVRQLGRRGPSSAPVKLHLQLHARTRDSFRSHCDKRADPRNEPENHHAEKKQQQNYHLVEELLNKKQALFAAMGVRVPPDMFQKEKEQISDYERKLSRSAHGRNLPERVVAQMVCSRVQEALDLASEVMDIAHDDPGTIEFSQHTTNQMVRTYASILYNVAGDAYHKKIGTETTLSFLHALRGLGAICHILVQDTVAKLKDGHLKNKFTHRMDTYRQEFYQKVNHLEDVVAKITEQKLQQIVTMMLLNGLDHATIYIFQLTERRKLALKYLRPKE